MVTDGHIFILDLPPIPIIPASAIHQICDGFLRFPSQIAVKSVPTSCGSDDLLSFWSQSGTIGSLSLLSLAPRRLIETGQPDPLSQGIPMKMIEFQ